MALCKKGRNYLAVDFRCGKKLLTFEPFAQRVRFNLPSAENDLPSIVLGYQSEAFEKLKWFFCYREEFNGPPKIILGRMQFHVIRANLRMEADGFPAMGLAKSFGLDFILERKVQDLQVVIASEVSAEVLHFDLFANTFLGSGGNCQLQLREESAFYYMPDYKDASCISVRAEMVWPQGS